MSESEEESNDVDSNESDTAKNHESAVVVVHTTENSNFNKFLDYFRSKNNNKFVRCKVCCKYPEIVKLHCLNSKPPPITTENGTRFLQQIVQDHSESAAHKNCYKAYMQSSFKNTDILQNTSIGRSITHANLALANHIGKLLIHVYSTAKKLTLSSYGFPARVATGIVAESFKYKTYDFNNITFNLNYATPASFRDFLEIIVQCNRPQLNKILSDSLANSLRCDGSVDRTQIDKIYTMLKIITKEGLDKLFFLGAAELEERGADGLLNAVQNGLKMTLKTDIGYVIKNTSSIVTDGTAVNSGDKGGLWTKFDAYRKSFFTENENLPPLLKIWCSAHR